MKALTLVMMLMTTVAHADPAQPLSWKRGTELMMFGAADLVAANQYLKSFGLEAIAANGQATVALAPGSFPDSNFGSFSMSFGAIMAKPVGASDGESWYFFGLGTSSDALNAAELSGWGIRAESAVTKVTLAGNSAAVTTTSSGHPYLELRMSEAPLVKQDAAYDFDVYSATRGGTVQYHHVCAGTAFNRDFNPAMDTYWADPASALGSVLTQIHFQPAQWSLYYTDTGTLALPISKR